jgi:hypothetical protein
MKFLLIIGGAVAALYVLGGVLEKGALSSKTASKTPTRPQWSDGNSLFSNNRAQCSLDQDGNSFDVECWNKKTQSSKRFKVKGEKSAMKKAEDWVKAQA